MHIDEIIESRHFLTNGKFLFKALNNFALTIEVRVKDFECSVLAIAIFNSIDSGHTTGAQRASDDFIGTYLALSSGHVLVKVLTVEKVNRISYNW